MIAEITAVLPYHNEETSLPDTLEMIARQTLMPREVIFVNSKSTDGGSALLDRWISENQGRLQTRFENLFAGTDTPSSSKNAGIRRAESPWLAFMDCGLNFSDDWLRMQWEFAQESGAEVVSGACYLSGIGIVDRCAIAQSYGYKRLRPCVPGTLLRKTVFDKTGLFLENRRAGYDMGWLILVERLGIKRRVNDQCRVSYSGVNYAPTLSAVFRKSLVYAVPTVAMKHYHTPYYYLFLLMLVAAACVLRHEMIAVCAALYLVLRGYAAPILKSKGVRIITDNPLSLVFLPVVGMVYDAGRVLGIFAGVFKYHVLKRN